MGKHLKKSAFRSIYQTMHWLIVVFVFVCVLICPESAVAQQDTGLPTWEMEEILVIGERSLHSLRIEVYKAENKKYKLFNSLNSTNEFDIKCDWIGGHIKRRVCDVGYMKKARREDLYRGILRSDFQRAVELAYKTEALNKEMVELGIKHPELAKAMINEYEIKQRYVLERRERFKDSILIGHPKPEKYFGDELKFLNVAYVAYNDGMLEEKIWDYWDRRLKSVIHQEPYRSIWLSSNSETFSDIFIAYVTAILWDNTVSFSAE